jgi:hypothetical protein
MESLELPAVMARVPSNTMIRIKYLVMVLFFWFGGTKESHPHAPFNRTSM